MGPSAGRWLSRSTWALTTTWGILRNRPPGGEHATEHSENPALLRACLACCLSSCLSGKGHLSDEISSTAVYSLNTYFVAGPVQGWREDAGPPGSPHTRVCAHTHTPILQSLPSHSWKDLRDRPGPRCCFSPHLEQSQSPHAALRLQTLLPLPPSRLWAISTCKCVGSPSCFLLTFFKPLFWSLII